MQTLTRAIAVTLFFVAGAACADPDCTGPAQAPATQSFTNLKTAGLISAEDADPAKVKVTRVASEKTGADLYRQVHRIIFIRRNGNPVEVLVVSNASSKDCATDGVETSVVFLRLGGGG